MDDPLLVTMDLYYVLPASGQNCSNNEGQLVDCSMIMILHWELVDSQEHPGTCGLLVSDNMLSTVSQFHSNPGIVCWRKKTEESTRSARVLT